MRSGLERLLLPSGHARRVRAIRIDVYIRMPGRILTAGPNQTIECSCRLVPEARYKDPGPRGQLVRRTLATTDRAESASCGVVVYTGMHTPRFWGKLSMAGGLDFFATLARPCRTS